MKKTRKVILVALSALTLILVPRIVGADEVRGKITQVAPDRSWFTLGDGTRFVLAEGVSRAGLKRGAEVRVRYERRGGRRIATQTTLANSEHSRGAHRGRAVPILDLDYLCHEWREFCW